MSMSDKMSQAGGIVTPQSKAPASATTVSKQSGNKKTEAFKASGEAIRAQMSDDQKAIEGSKSDKVAFVACLGNPARAQARKTGGEYTDSYQVVGYQLKVLEDCAVPVAPLAEQCKDILDVVTPPSMRNAKAGEVVNLNVVETAMFISRPEYAGTFAGEGKTVYISAVSSQARKDPYPCLKTTDGSIKENMILIAEMEGQENGKGGVPRIKEEFAAFAPLYVKKKSKRAGSGASRVQGDAIKNTAAAFRQLYGI